MVMSKELQKAWEEEILPAFLLEEIQEWTIVQIEGKPYLNAINFAMQFINCGDYWYWKLTPIDWDCRSASADTMDVVEFDIFDLNYEPAPEPIEGEGVCADVIREWLDL